MEWADSVDYLKRLVEQGQDVPVLRRRPQIRPHLLFYWEAYTAVSNDRGGGMAGPTPIPFSSIDRFAKRYGIDGIDEFDRLLRIIQMMDAAYLKFAAEQLEKEEKRRGKGT